MKNLFSFFKKNQLGVEVDKEMMQRVREEQLYNMERDLMLAHHHRVRMNDYILGFAATLMVIVYIILLVQYLKKMRYA